MFNFFKRKKSSDYDPLNLQVTDLKTGFIFEYDLRTWEVQEEYTYDWGDEFFTKEYRVSDGTEIRYLGVDDDDEVELTWSEKIQLSELPVDIESEVARNERPPKEIAFRGIAFHRAEESPGYFQGKAGNWVELISWDYYDQDNEYVLNIEQWDDRSFEAAFGKVIETFEISNITPAA